MRSSYNPKSSARRVSPWLMVLFGLAGYVGVIFGLTLLPLQIEVDLPHWGMLALPPMVYGLLVLLVVRRPSVLGFIAGTVVLSGLHFLLAFAREPLTGLLDPALAGRPLPWTMPPPLPELIGVVFLLMPLRDVLRAPARSAREKAATGGRASSPRGRAGLTPRSPQVVAAESGGSLSDVLLSARPEPTPEPVTPSPAPEPEPPAETRRRRAAARAERRRAAERDAATPRSDAMLRIALDRIMTQLPPGTFLAPEEEVAASLPVPGYLLIPGQLVVTQLAEGIATVAWRDIADQFPAQLVGLTHEAIGAHLHDGLRLPIDEVIGQLPHELFVADTPEIEIPGLDRIPVPFHPLEESSPAPGLLSKAPREARPTEPEERPRVVPPPVVTPRPAAVEARVAEPIPAAAPAPAAPPRIEPAPAPVGSRETARPAAAATSPVPTGQAVVEPVVRISFGRVASELPPDAFKVPVETLADRLSESGHLLVPQALVVPQLAEGLIRVSWSVVAPQFPHDQMTISDEEMAATIPDGIQLPIDEIIRQLPSALFATGGAAVDIRGLENFPAPFQPFVSDPAPAVAEPEPVRAPVATPAPEAVVPAPGPIEAVVVGPPVAEAEAVTATDIVEELRDVPALEPEILLETPVVVGPAAPDVAVDDRPLLALDPEPPSVVVPAPAVARDPAPALPEVPALPELMEKPAPVELTPSAKPVAAPHVVEPEPAIVAVERAIDSPRAVEPLVSWQPPIPEPTSPPSAAGSAEAAEVRRLTALLSPISSFDASVQVMEGVTVYALASPTVSHETTMVAAGLALPLLTDRRPPWAIDQLTLRGPDTTLVLTPLGGSREKGPVLAAAAPRGGALALLEILSRRAANGATPAGDRAEALPLNGRGLAEAPVPAHAASLATSLTAFGAVSPSVRRDAAGECTVYFFLPPGADSAAAGHLAQDLQALMRKASGSGATFRSAVLRSGDTLVVFQPEEVAHGRSVVVVAGGEVTRPGLAYRQVERAVAALAKA